MLGVHRSIASIPQKQEILGDIQLESSGYFSSDKEVNRTVTKATDEVP